MNAARFITITLCIICISSSCITSHSGISHKDYSLSENWVMQENSCSPCQQTDVLDFIVIKTDNFNAEGIDSCIIKFAEEFSNPGYNIYSPRTASKSKKSNPKDIYEEDAYWAVDHYLLHINESKNFIILCNPDDLELTRNLIKTLPEEALLKLKGAYTKDKDCSFSPFYDSKSNN